MELINWWVVCISSKSPPWLTYIAMFRTTQGSDVYRMVNARYLAWK